MEEKLLAEIAKAGTPSVTTVGIDPGSQKLPTLPCGEAIAAGDACYIKNDGNIWRSNGGLGLSAPNEPALSTATTGGTVLAGTYEGLITYVNPNGETTGSAVADIQTTGSTSTITVTSPAAAGSGGSAATAYKVYMSPANGGPLTLQNGAGTAIGTPFVLTAPPTTNGATPPTSNGTLTAANVVRGWAPTKANAGEVLTLVHSVVFSYGSSLTPGADYYLSGTVIGGIADAPSSGGLGKVAFAIDTTRIFVKSSGY